ncbi:helix-turn-helix domain-containing protein [Secundilactobacillus yichangensis]|uniref:helix-turn-helix domain-containing protein n=1 Tax=Secundilactobacillus yichangensis TaxID=2799580 RepID=UPI001943F49B|nr:helix-turn-helix transcriptional regulator [Secundilactobacillus yichangensis]
MNNNFSRILGEKRLRISQVHKATGIARSTLTEFYYGDRNLNLKTILKLCDYLNVSLSELIEYTPKTTVKQ